MNKYYLYFFLLAVLVVSLFHERIHALIFFTRTNGVVRQFEYSQITLGEGGRRTKESFVPIIDFQVNDTLYSFYGSSLHHDELHRLEKVEVLYNPKNPAEANINSFIGLWGDRLVYFIPIFVMLTGLFLSNGTLPKYLFQKQLLNKKAYE